MAGFVGYKKNAWDNATNVQRAVLRTVLNSLELGNPVLYTDGTDEWYVFHDNRINPAFVENLAWFNSILASITTAPDRDYPTTEIVQVEVPVYAEVEYPVLDENGDPTGETYTVWEPTGETQLVDQEQSLGDPLKLAADAQGAVAWFSARTSIPDTFSPVNTEG